MKVARHIAREMTQANVQLVVTAPVIAEFLTIIRMIIVTLRACNAICFLFFGRSLTWFKRPVGQEDKYGSF